MIYLKTFKLSESRSTDLNIYPFCVFKNKEPDVFLFNDITVLYGNNGSGKSTILNMIAYKLNLKGKERNYSRIDGWWPYFENYSYECEYELGENEYGSRLTEIPPNSRYIKSEEIGTILYIAVNNKFAGTIVISDKIKTDAKETIDKLKKDNIKKIVMLTGDKRKVGENVAKKLGIDEVYTELLPSDKVEKVEELMKNKSENGNLAFIGDGINDAPVLAISDIGIAMGGLGSDAAIEAADVVLMTDEPSRVVDAIKISKKTMTIVKQNIIFAISIKLIVLILSAIGISNMWQAVFADVGVSILAILNALRALYIRR